MALQGVALCCLGTAAVLRVVDFTRTGSGLAVAILWVASVPLICALWVVRPRLVRAGHAVGSTALAVVLATPVAVFGTLGFTIPVLLLVVAFAVVDVSLRAGVYAATWISGVGFALLISGGFGSWDAFADAVVQAMINVVPVAVLLCFGIVLGLALRGFEQRKDADAKVIDRLRRVAEIEKELVLSDERARSARELHDGLGHRLTLVSMSLELAERMRATDAGQAWKEIRTAKDTSSDALTEMRTWVRALNPVRDAGARGLAALELIAESFRGTGVTVEVSGDDASDDELTHNDSTALLIYRAADLPGCPGRSDQRASAQQGAQGANHTRRRRPPPRPLDRQRPRQRSLDDVAGREGAGSRIRIARLGRPSGRARGSDARTPRRRRIHAEGLGAARRAGP
ncbi:histidine kinase [Rhodococcus rhodnii]|uniref:histidine kinase n=3 Tax=Rhodococcus rhodnii TaxID=38312 RepID=R7WTE2_9NOCA|nr:hypothetical protein Rrhod_1204 [Rhodococcus rhodnii LMG 5362]TXG90642.1 histidine kinase [Rhodococcus rhodnii]